MHATDQGGVADSQGKVCERLLAALHPERFSGQDPQLDIAVGPFWTGVRTSLGAGMASTLWSEGWHHHGTAVAGAGRLRERSPAELAALLRSSSKIEAAIGLATVNGLLPAPTSGVVEANASEVLAERGAGRRVAVVGHFPFVDKLRPLCRELWVFERGAGLGPGDLPETKMAELLPRAEVVAVTATTLVNHTLEPVLRHREPGSLWLMLGPSTPFAPQLFELGFDALCGTVVEGPEEALRAIREGATARQIPGCRRLVWWGSEGG